MLNVTGTNNSVFKNGMEDEIERENEKKRANKRAREMYFKFNEFPS